MDETAIISSISQSASIEIMGHTFNGLSDVYAAVEITAVYSLGKIRVLGGDDAPSKPVEGIHVAEIYERYPCFDYYDRWNERRCFHNFFFSREPFTQERLEELYATCRPTSNFCMVKEGMPANCAPALYADDDKAYATLAQRPPSQPE
jgi:hypothetical protein